MKRIIQAVIMMILLGRCSTTITAAELPPRTFPRDSWTTQAPAQLGLSSDPLDEIATLLGSRGCIIYRGYVVKSWGSQSQKSDWYSSAKPVLSTLLFFAVQEGKVKSVDQPIIDFGWPLKPKDRSMTFRHLADMTSGYARSEPPGAAWAYNDYAIMLYQKTLFEKVYQQPAGKVANDPNRLGCLGLEDGLSFSSKSRLKLSVRDFARLGWFWLNRGKWRQQQVLKTEFSAKYVRPDVPKNLPHTAQADTDDYLQIGSYGGGSDHFTSCGAGIYGFNFWFNNTGRLHPDRQTWPDAPKDTFMTIGARGNSSMIIPSLDIVIVAADADWGPLQPGSKESNMNRIAQKIRTAFIAPPDVPTR